MTASSTQSHCQKWQRWIPISNTKKTMTKLHTTSRTVSWSDLIMYRMSKLIGIIMIISILLPITVTGKETMDEFMDRLEKEVIDLSYAVHLAFEPKDNTNCDWLTSCIKENYEHCSSKFPNELCYNIPFNDTSIVSSCERDFLCGTKFDYTTSVVHIPEEVSLFDSNNNNNNEMKHRIFESICRTRTLDDNFFIPWWMNSALIHQIEPYSIFFASNDGMIRTYPGRQTNDVNNMIGKRDNYDPSMTSWYNAASTGRHNVILLLELSQSIISDNYTNLQRMKDAASHIVRATTVNDFIAIVMFDASGIIFISSCKYLSTPSLCEGNAMNKELFLSTINQLNSSSSTTTTGTSNFYKAYNTSFNLLNQYGIYCSTSIMLFTDNPKQAQYAIQAHKDRIKQIESKKTLSIILYGYILNQSSINDIVDYDCVGSTFHTSIWSKMTNDREIVSALLPYFEVRQVAYRLIKQQQNNSTILASTDYKTLRQDDVAWVEPYNFSSIFGVIGTTVSAPVYDSTNRLLGVVGINYGLAAIKGIDYFFYYSKIMNRARNTTAIKDDCLFDLTNSISPCMFRFDQRTNYNVLCNTNGSVGMSNTCINNSTMSISSLLNDINVTKSKQCCTSHKINCEDITVTSSSILWKNIDYNGTEYSKRGCCTSNDTLDTYTIDNKFTTFNTIVRNEPEQCIYTSSIPNSNSNSKNNNNNDNSNERKSESLPRSTIIVFSIGGFFIFILFITTTRYYKQYGVFDSSDGDGGGDDGGS